MGNDIHKNLEIPLDSIKEKTGTKISIAKRTGDTPTSERVKLLRNPPNILITTPESFALMLTAPKFKIKLRTIKWIIVDEIHSIAENKRGTMLSLCIERLQYHVGHELTRIGLSATIEPPNLIANFLLGNRDSPINIIDFGRKRRLELDVILPISQIDLAPFSMLHKKQLEIIKSEVKSNTTTLIFTNTRHLSERMVFELREAFDGKIDHEIGVHHGSLDKKLRLSVEDKLKKGLMKAVFTSTSLEMGIDIGSIDLIIQLGSTKTTRAMLQRIGRSGHQNYLTSRGKVLSFSLDDFIESMAISRLALNGEIDEIRIPEQPIDVLIQIIIGMSVEQKWTFQDAYSIIIHSYPYRKLTERDFIEVLKTAANPSNDDNGWKYSNIWFDDDIMEFGKRKRARQAYMQNVGTIPSVSLIDVVLEGYQTRIGKISEKFAERLTESDVFILHARTFKFIRSVGTKLIVKEVHGEIPTIPSWVGEGQSRTWEISEEISRIYDSLDVYLSRDDLPSALKWLTNEYPISSDDAKEVLNYISIQKSFTPLPSRNH
ncbi:MAG: helicase-related protein, partial [Candidatus Kariarchaeaceae archaeon]